MAVTIQDQYSGMVPNARAQRLIEAIGYDPRAVRAALGLQTEEDLAEAELFRERFEEWRCRTVKRLREGGKL
jgi:hypothetical protein